MTPPQPGYEWVKLLMWRDPDGRTWPVPSGYTRIVAEAEAITWGPGWSVVEVDAQRLAS